MTSSSLKQLTWTYWKQVISMYQVKIIQKSYVWEYELDTKVIDQKF